MVVSSSTSRESFHMDNTGHDQYDTGSSSIGKRSDRIKSRHCCSVVQRMTESFV